MLGYCALEVHTHLMYQVQNVSAARLNPKPPRPRIVQLPGPEIHRKRGSRPLLNTHQLPP